MKQADFRREFVHWFRMLIVPVFCSAVYSFDSSAQNYLPVIPGRLADDSFSTIPFSGGSNTVRFQQVYDAAGFIEEGGNRPFLIQLIAFREDAGRREGFFSSFPDFQINLSTTSRAVDALSPILANNVGADDRAVVPRGPFQIGVSSGGGFTAFIGLAAAPFYYDPSQGDLLLDIRNFGGGRTGWGYPPFMGLAHVDASNVAGDRVSSVFGTVDSPTGTTSTLGLVTQFWITPVTRLTVFRQSGNLLFRWVRIHSQDGFMLQQSAIIGPGANWQPVAQMTITNGSYKEVTLPLDSVVAAKFFRLSWQTSSPGADRLQSNSDPTAPSNQED
jgi:hypothetical protein